MPTKCLTPVKGRRLRATRVDACGRPIFAGDSQAVTKGFITVALTALTTESDAVEQQNAAGETCVFEPSETTLNGYSAVITFCEVDPELFALITGQSAYANYSGDAVGFTVNTKITITNGFALEMWTGSPAGDACENPDAQGSYGYILLPFLKGGIVGDYTVENGAITFQIQGATTRDGNHWGVGPYNVMLDGAVPKVLPTALDANDHKLVTLVDVAPPEAACGTRPLLDPEATGITDVTAIKGATAMTTEFDFTGATATPFWIDFGDGTWAYGDDATDGASHVYAANGTYTVTASTNGTWRTVSVTIPWP
jgi:hypothetical protein